MKEIYDAIPQHCFERDTLRSFGYLARDVAMALSLGLAASYITWLPHPVLRFFAWILYGIAQGMVCTGLWVLAHECGHQAFSPSKLVNDTTGWIVHSALLVPYFSWKYSHAKHHKATGHIERDMVFKPKTKSVKAAACGGHAEMEHSQLMELIEETPMATLFTLAKQQLLGWPAYLLANVTGQTYSKAAPNTLNHFHPDSPLYEPGQRNDILISDLGILLTFTALGFATRTFGWDNVFLFYVMPYLWVNHWLVMVTFLQHTDPALPHYRGEEWSFQRESSVEPL